MIPGINQKQLKQAMKQLGMKQEEIDASEVVIKTASKQIIIREPSVIRLNIAGNESFQISGRIEEASLERFGNEEIEMVMKQANVDYNKAKQALEKEGDIAGAILALQQNKT